MNIVELALAVQNKDQVETLKAALVDAASGEFHRPLGDNWSNYTILSSQAEAETLLFERVTNGHDAVLADAIWRTHGTGEKDIPYTSPREAASSLLSWPQIADDRTERVALGRRVTVAFRDSDDSRRRPTIEIRDTGCGVSPIDVPFTLCSLAGGNKQQSLWTLGTFGKGGSTCVPYSDATILVTRRQPALLGPGEDDLISVVLILGKYQIKAPAWYYLVADEFDERRPSESGHVFTFPADSVDFEPGTYVAHINYDASNFGRQSLRSDTSIQIVGETALLDPVLPWRFEDRRTTDNVRTSEDMEGGTGLTFVGTRRKLDAGRGQVLEVADSEIPVLIGNKPYRLPVKWWIFEAASRSSFVARKTVVAFTSNGQTHHNWDEAAFARHTGLNKVGTRLFAHVDTDPLPVPVRSELFTTDRTAFRSSRERFALEAAVGEWFAAEPAVEAANRELIKQAVRSHVGDDLSDRLLDQINRQLELRGFGGGNGNGGGGRKKVELLSEPTYLSGPEEISIVAGESASLILEMNAVDRFYPDRGEMAIDYDDDFPGALGNGSSLQRGRLQLRIAVPTDAELGTWQLSFNFGFVSSNGAYKELEWDTKVRIVAKRQTKADPPSKSKKHGVAVVWKSRAEEEAWTDDTVGILSAWPASALADYSQVYRERYADLLNDDPMVSTIELNSDFLFLKKYIQGSVEATRTDQTVTRRKNQYALGVSVAIGLLTEAQRKRRARFEAGDTDSVMDDQQLQEAIRASARGVLTLLPDFDSILDEVGAAD